MCIYFENFYFEVDVRVAAWGCHISATPRGLFLSYKTNHPKTNQKVLSITLQQER